MRFLIAALSAAALLVSANADAFADKRVAFVVGNGAYKNVPALPNPAVDAKSMARVLRNVGFEVVEGANLTRDKMTEKLLDFGKKAEGADVALFFYAGHGIAVNGANYLLPVDADLKSEMDVKLGAAINVDLTLEQTMGDAKVKLVFLDACRDNPFAAKIRSAKATRSVNVQTGLAEMKSGEGTLIAFATGPGQTALDGEAGTNSPFTRALLANIAQPGVEIQQAMTKVRAQVNDETAKGQLPWGHTNLIGTVYLNPAKAGCARPTRRTRRRRPRRQASEVELEFWRSIKDSNKVEELNAYLTNYPNGTFKSIALARIAALQDGPSNTTRNLTTGIDRPGRLLRRSHPDDRRPARPRQEPAPRRAAPPHRPRLRRQGDRQVRRRHPRRDHPLAGRPRLSEDRLPQRAPAQGAAVRDPLDPRRLLRATTAPTTSRRASRRSSAAVAAAALIAAAAAVARPICSA